MENLINWLKELFTKSIILWNMVDYLIAAILFIVCVSIFLVFLVAIYGIVEKIKKRNKGKDKK